ncbi:YjiH family protein [Photobacterium arenosum]|nr:YjiH family protein [Photobacterium arenosum]
MSEQVITGANKRKAPWLMFILPSFIGVLLFMAPITVGGEITIPIALMAKAIQNLFEGSLTAIVTTVITLTALCSTLVRLIKPRFIERKPFIANLFKPSLPWYIVQLLGATFAILTFFKVGPVAIFDGNTGGLVLNDLLPVLFAVFLCAGFFLPLLTSFGLLEFFGAMLTKIMRPLFNLPGRSAIDCMASWLADGSVGVLLTSKQYEEGFYTKREAAVIGTTFSAVSITFSLVVIAQVNLEHMFLPFYATVCLAGVVAAIVVPRLPPLSRKRDEFVCGTPADANMDALPNGHTVLSFGLEKAFERANTVTSLRKVVNDGVKAAVDMVFGVLPVVMAIGTLALLVAENTPVFDWLGKPFIPLLELLQIPEATEASKTIVVGFADMFLPSILATEIQSDLTRFVIAALSVTQLIYMSEIGALLLGSKIPVKAWELFVIFILRTLVTLPVIALMAHLIF